MWTIIASILKKKLADKIGEKAAQKVVGQNSTDDGLSTAESQQQGATPAQQPAAFNPQAMQQLSQVTGQLPDWNEILKRIQVAYPQQQQQQNNFNQY